MRPKGVWYRTFRRLAGGNNSVVECDLAKVEVAGSNPVSRSIFSPAPNIDTLAAWPSGKAEVCKTSIPSSSLGAASFLVGQG